MRAKIRHLGILERFTAVALLVGIAVGGGLWYLLARDLKTGVIDQTVRSAEIFARTEISAAFAGDAPADGFRRPTIKRLDGIVKRGRAGEALVGLVISNARGVAVFSRPAGGGAAVGYVPVAGPSRVDVTAQTVTVAVPLGAEGARIPPAQAELRLPFEPARVSIAHQRRRVAIWIGLALAALLAIVFTIVARMCRSLRREVEQHQFEALHDPLTSLPNRTLFNDRVEQRVRERRREGEAAAMMLVDLDRFKEVNDTFGHRAGDILLVEVARRLSTRLRTSDTVARLGGDEFGVLLPRVAGTEGATKVVEALRKSLAVPMVMDGVAVTIEASIGVAMLDEHSHDAAGLIHCADRAMYQAKKKRSGHAFYDPSTDGDEHDDLALISDLRRAIARGELRLHYQPKAQLRTRNIRSVEALVRWQHPERGLLTPNVFVPLAESSGLIRQLTYWVLDESMRQAREWADRGHALKIAVNLSQQSLLDETMPDEIARVLERHRVPATALEIEITESALVTDLAAANAALSQLDRMGITLSIDDYGTGHSSLAHVRALPVSWIKIDRSFVSGMLVDPTNATIVRSTIELARDLGIRVVAEGVETMEEWEGLATLGCHVAQGYLISRPKPGLELIEWLDRTGFAFRMDAKAEASTPMPDFA